MSPYDPQVPGSPGTGEELERDVLVDKPGIIGARWWHKSLVAEDRAVQRRQVLKGLAVAGGVMGAISLVGVGIAKLVEEPREKVSLDKRAALAMQKRYGWDFGARGKDLVFDGVSEAPFVRSELEHLAQVMTPRLNAKFQVPTLVESLLAQPAMSLPDPPDGSPRADAAPFRRLADVIVPIATPAMERAYRVGEAFARLCADAPHVAALVDLPGPEAVAFAAGACGVFEPVLLFDNWPHPHGVVPSHLALAALAYYQPRFAEQARSRRYAEPLFVADRSRLLPYSDDSDRFDNRYYARVPKLQTLARDGIKSLFYVVAAESDLPEPDDVNASVAPESATSSVAPDVAVRALALTDFGPVEGSGPTAYAYGGSAETDGSFWINYPFSPTFRQQGFQRVASSSTPAVRFQQRAPTGPAPESLGRVAVLVTASGLLVAAALDRRGSMNRFSGGWGG